MNCMKVCEEQCISYWLSKLPLQLSSLKTTNIHYFIVPVNQESGSSLVGCPWLRVFHEVIVKLLPGAAVISRLDRVWRIYFKAHSRGPLCRLFTCQLAVSHPPPREWSKTECPRRKAEAFYNLISRLAYHYVCCILLTKSEPRSSAHSRGEDRLCAWILRDGRDRWEPSKRLPTTNTGKFTPRHGLR